MDRNENNQFIGLCSDVMMAEKHPDYRKTLIKKAFSQINDFLHDLESDLATVSAFVLGVHGLPEIRHALLTILDQRATALRFMNYEIPDPLFEGVDCCKCGGFPPRYVYEDKYFCTQCFIDIRDEWNKPIYYENQFDYNLNSRIHEPERKTA